MKTVALQSVLSVVLIVIAVFAPPTRGAMIAVPLGGSPAHVLIRQEGVALVGAGPLQGSLIIQATDIPLRFALSHGIMLMRASAIFCSTESQS